MSKDPRVKVVEVDDENEICADKLRVGDVLLIGKENELRRRSMKLFAGSKQLVELTRAPKRMLAVPLSVTKQLSQLSNDFDLVSAYVELYRSNRFEQLDNSYNAIELDFRHHSSLLASRHSQHSEQQKQQQQQLNKLDEQDNTRFYYLIKEPTSNANTNDFCGGYYVWLERAKAYLPIKENTKIEHLVVLINQTSISEKQKIDQEEDEDKEEDKEEEEKEEEEEDDELKLLPDELRDFEMEEYAARFKQVYENDFHEYLKNLKKGEPLNGTALPTAKYNKETFEADSMNSLTLTFYFDSVELDEAGRLSSVLADSFDRAERCHFQVYNCKKYGPYYDTTLFACLCSVGRANSKADQATRFFLDLPVHLYYKLDEND
jgi:hypothetical protein